MDRYTAYTLILGAEGQLGKAIAREVAHKGSNLILVSTTSLDLQRFAIRLQLKKDVLIEAVKINLADREAIQRFTDTIRTRYKIRALINNITCDWSVAHNRYISEIARNDFTTRFRGAAQLTMGLIPHMKQHAASYIQHVIPFPFGKEALTPELRYSVSRIYAFSRELEGALKETGISVSMVYPAPMGIMTPRVELSEGEVKASHTLTPGMIAAKAVSGMLRGDRHIIPGFRNRIRFFLKRLATSWLSASEEPLGSSLQPSA
ncbi:MAG: SDR family NAD(P)-dependent oxidoreductase [Bacteroidota bacterium]